MRHCSSWSEKEPLNEETDIVLLQAMLGGASLRCEKVVEAHEIYEWSMRLVNFSMSSIFCFSAMRKQK